MKINKFLPLLALLASTSGISFSALAEIVVIVHPSNNVASLDKSQVKKLFLAKTDKFTDGSKANPGDQPEGTSIRSSFYEAVTNKNDTQMKAYWSKMIFSGKAAPPKVLDNGAAVKAWVAANSDGIGYIDSSLVDASVKIIFTVP